MKKKIIGLCLFLVMLIGMCTTVNAEDTINAEITVDLAIGDTSREITFKFETREDTPVDIQDEFNYSFKNKEETGKVKTGSKLTVESGDKLLIDAIPKNIKMIITPSENPGYVNGQTSLTTTGTLYGNTNHIKMTSDKAYTEYGDIVLNFDSSAYQFYGNAKMSFSIKDPEGNSLKNRYEMGNLSMSYWNYISDYHTFYSPSDCKKGAMVFKNLPVGSTIVLGPHKERTDIEYLYDPIVVKTGTTECNVTMRQAFRDLVLKLKRDSNMHDTVYTLKFVLEPATNDYFKVPCSGVEYKGSTVAGTCFKNTEVSHKFKSDEEIVFKNVPCTYDVRFTCTPTDEYSYDEYGHYSPIEMVSNQSPVEGDFWNSNKMTLNLSRKMKEVYVTRGTWGSGISEVITGLGIGYSLKDTNGKTVTNETFTDSTHTCTYTGNDSLKLKNSDYGLLVMPRSYTLDFMDYAIKGYNLGIEGNHNDKTNTYRRTARVLASRKVSSAIFNFEVEDGLEGLEVTFENSDPVSSYISNLVKGDYKLNGSTVKNSDTVKVLLKNGDKVELPNLMAESYLRLCNIDTKKYSINMHRQIPVSEDSTKNIYNISIKSLKSEPTKGDVTINLSVEDPSEHVPMLKIYLSKDKEGKDIIKDSYSVSSKELGDGIVKPGFSVKPVDTTLTIRDVPFGYYVNIVPDSKEYYNSLVQGSNIVSKEGTTLDVVLRPQKLLVEETPKKEEVKPAEPVKEAVKEPEQKLIRTGETLSILFVGVLVIFIAVCIGVGYKRSRSNMD